MLQVGLDLGAIFSQFPKTSKPDSARQEIRYVHSQILDVHSQVLDARSWKILRSGHERVRSRGSEGVNLSCVLVGETVRSSDRRLKYGVVLWFHGGTPYFETARGLFSGEPRSMLYWERICLCTLDCLAKGNYSCRKSYKSMRAVLHVEISERRIGMLECIGSTAD